MAVDQTRYRQFQFEGARILEAREVNDTQYMAQGVAFDDATVSSYPGSTAVYRQGAVFNMKAVATGLTVVLSAINNTLPMLVFVRDRWEAVKTPEIETLTFNGTQTKIFLNWQLIIRTSTDDSTLVDQLTNQATANAGELILDISLTDISAVSLASNQLAKNTSPIVIFQYTNSGSALTTVAVDNTNVQALATQTYSGLVTTTTATTTVASTDDPRLTNNRSASDGSVHDATVRVPTAIGGNNSDGTPIYNLTGDIGGISAAKIVLTATTQLMSDAYNWLKTQFLALQSLFNAHSGAALGQANTHPLPTAAQVGAAPISHVGLPLGLSTSHPPTTSKNSGGFALTRDHTNTPAAFDPAFGVFNDNSGTAIVALTHDADVISNAAAAFTASPLVESGDGTLANGSLLNLALIAAVLSQHVNKTSHKNPHGLAPADIGAATTGYVDTAVANVLSTSENYTNAYTPSLSISTVSVTGSGVTGKYVIFRFAPNNGNGIEIAYGTGIGLSNSNNVPGYYGTGSNFTIPLPNGSFTSGNCLPSVSLYQLLPNPAGFLGIVAIGNPSALTYNGYGVGFDNGGGLKYPTFNAQLAWTNICWRQGA